MANLFARKPLDKLMAEAQEVGEHSLKRSLGPTNLVMLGIGGIIGAGLFVRTAAAIADRAGPSVVLAFILAGVGCAFAGLCYAEFASMIPVSGSAYTYSYATLGEFIAWIIGWDLILEYAVGNMSVAASWSGYFVQLLGNLPFGLSVKFPLWAVTDHKTALATIATGGDALQNYSSTSLPIIFGHSMALNLPAFFIVAAVTILLIRGIRESAGTNTTIVIVKVAVVVFVIAFGA